MQIQEKHKRKRKRKKKRKRKGVWHWPLAKAFRGQKVVYNKASPHSMRELTMELKH